jgi:hypothetical protein
LPLQNTKAVSAGDEKLREIKKLKAELRDMIREFMVAFRRVKKQISVLNPELEWLHSQSGDSVNQFLNY